MRELIFYSAKARTSGKFDDLMSAGRLDIVCHTIIQSLFVSHSLRNDVILHLVFDGPPNPTKHIEIHGSAKLPFIKSDVAKALKKLLYKGEKGREEVFPGYFVDKTTLPNLIKQMEKDGKQIFTLDGRGSDVRELKDEAFDNGVFLMGDDDGLPKKFTKFGTRVSVGPTTYFASQVIAVLHNEYDRRLEVVDIR